MHNPSNSFIVIEGGDGAGKTTQFNLLKARLEAVGYDVDVYKFPRYDSSSSYFVQKYLAGDYGDATEVNPYTASLFFAMDRFEAATEIRKSLKAGHIVLADRYVGSNMAYQGAKFDNPIEQRGFLVWDDNLEFGLLNIPRPDTTLFLRVPADVSYQLAKDRAARTGGKLHGLEDSVSHLKKSVETYDLLCKLFPKDFQPIDCTKDGKLLSIPDISNLIWEQLQPLLPPRPKGKGSRRTVKLEVGLSQPKEPKIEGEPEVQIPHSSSDVNVMTSLDLILPIRQAVPSARFEAWDGKSYQRDFAKDSSGELKKSYEQFIDEAGHGYQKMVAKLGKNAKLAMATAPISARVNVSFSPSEKEVKNLLAALAAVNSNSARLLASAVKKSFPQIDEDVTKPAGIDSVLSGIAARLKDNNLPPEGEVSLIEAHPKNELQLLADIVYPLSDLPKKQVERNLEAWSYEQKTDALSAAITARDPRILSQITYRFDALISDFDLVRLLRHGLIEQLVVQPPTPRLGYGMPEEIEKLGLSDDFEHAFDHSLEFYSIAETDESLTKAAVLFGHKRRCQLSISAASLVKMLEGGDKELAKELAEKAAELHPIAIEALLSKK